MADAFSGNQLLRVDVDRAPKVVALAPDGKTLYAHATMRLRWLPPGATAFTHRKCGAEPRRHQPVAHLNESQGGQRVALRKTDPEGNRGHAIRAAGR